MKTLNPPEASRLLASDENAVLIDVRSTPEYEYVGHPPDALHVPLKEPPEWETDPGFAAKVRAALGRRPLARAMPREARPLLLLCRSGQRSALGAELLEQAGFSAVYNILEGFEGERDENGHRSTKNGWRFHGLPWAQS